MANILGVGTEDVSGISALKETVENLENNVSIAQSAVEDLEGIVNSVDVTAIKAQETATDAKQLAAAAYPKVGGSLEGVINPSFTGVSSVDESSASTSPIFVLAAPKDKGNDVLYVSGSKSSQNGGAILGFGKSETPTDLGNTIIRGVAEPTKGYDAVNLNYFRSNSLISRAELSPWSNTVSQKQYINSAVGAMSAYPAKYEDCLFINCTITRSGVVNQNMEFTNCTFIGCTFNFFTKATSIKFIYCNINNCYFNTPYTMSECELSGCSFPSGGLPSASSQVYMFNCTARSGSNTAVGS